MYFSKSYLPSGYFTPEYFGIDVELVAGALRATLAGSGAVQGDVVLVASLSSVLPGVGTVTHAYLVSDLVVTLSDFEKFVASAAKQIREVVEVLHTPHGAHFVVNFSVRNTKLERRLDGIASAVKTRWPGYAFSWSPLGDRPYNVDNFSPPFTGAVPTAVGLPYPKRKKRSFV